jgi:hypothetical protein
LARHLLKSMKWYCRNPSGGAVPSSEIGTSRPRSRPCAASSRTQSEWTDCADHTTTTASARSSALSIVRANASPPSISASHQTCCPAALSASVRWVTASRSARA